jgi:hypothetical protein
VTTIASSATTASAIGNDHQAAAAPAARRMMSVSCGRLLLGQPLVDLQLAVDRLADQQPAQLPEPTRRPLDVEGRFEVALLVAAEALEGASHSVDRIAGSSGPHSLIGEPVVRETKRSGSFRSSLGAPARFG